MTDKLELNYKSIVIINLYFQKVKLGLYKNEEDCKCYKLIIKLHSRTVPPKNTSHFVISIFPVFFLENNSI